MKPLLRFAPFLLLLVAGGEVLAQARPVAAPPLGTVCTRPTLNGTGMVKLDLCGRRYCGSQTWSEPFEMRPLDKKRVPCTFKLVNDRCLCVSEKT